MLQVLIKKGQVVTENVPSPMARDGSILIKVMASCISAGTEIQSVQASSHSIFMRVMKQPSNIAKAIQIARNEGVSRTIDKIKGQLDAGMQTGYSISGIVIDVGKGVKNFAKGDRVAAAGAGMANHAEFVEVPKNLVVQVPENVKFNQAATVTMGAIAMQAVRRADIKIGEYTVVVGTGILGMLVVQLLVMAGARVVAVDIDEKRLRLARDMGAELCIRSENDNSVNEILHFTNGQGADAMLFCAATNNAKVLSNTFAATRKKGRVVMVGTWGNELNRDDIYKKELDFLISTSYGPGRYDAQYEIKGQDYPYAYVRWTENRNMVEYLRLISVGRLKIDPLIQAEYPVSKAKEAFEAFSANEKPLIVILRYENEHSGNVIDVDRVSHTVAAHMDLKSAGKHRIRVALIGAGNFASGMHLPNLIKLKDTYEIHAICNRTGAGAQSAAKKFGAKYATTDHRQILSDESVDLVMICTRHDLHGHLALESLKAGKHTFVEKPLCTTLEEFEELKAFYYGGSENKLNEQFHKNQKPVLMVGFNRRFSTYASELKKHLRTRINPLIIHYRMNAGYIPLDHWVHSEEGGGRIIGEACHIIDLFSYLIDSKVTAASVASLGTNTGSISGDDNKVITLEYEDGSVAVLEYFSIGSEKFPKETLEVHYDQKTIVIDNYSAMRGYGVSIKKIKTSHPEKGQLQELRRLSETILGKQPCLPISIESLFETTGLCFQLSRQDVRL